MTGIKKGLVCLALFILVAIGGMNSARAHPHVFISQQTRFVFDEMGLEGIRVSWFFDEMFSTVILGDFDRDQNGILDRAEVGIIEEKAFGYIAPHNYYIHIKIDGRPFPVTSVTDFNARVNQGKLIYEFFIPCSIRAEDVSRQIILSPYDPEYYSAISFSDEKAMVENGSDFKVELIADIDRSNLIFFETVNPHALFLAFKLKL